MNRALTPFWTATLVALAAMLLVLPAQAAPKSELVDAHWQTYDPAGTEAVDHQTAVM